MAVMGGSWAEHFDPITGLPHGATPWSATALGPAPRHGIGGVSIGHRAIITSSPSGSVVTGDVLDFG